MASMRTRLARVLLLFLALLGLSVGLAACATTAAATQTPTEMPTRPTTSTAVATMTPPQALAPTPTHVPAGWIVLATPQFSLAYPAGFSVNTIPPSADYPFTLYDLTGATKETTPPVRLSVQPQAQVLYLDAYCAPKSDYQTFANLPMRYDLEGEASAMRTWDFANSDGTVYILQAGDSNEDATTQAADTAILATFRSADATPWRC